MKVTVTVKVTVKVKMKVKVNVKVNVTTTMTRNRNRSVRTGSWCPFASSWASRWRRIRCVRSHGTCFSWLLSGSWTPPQRRFEREAPHLFSFGNSVHLNSPV